MPGPNDENGRPVMLDHLERAHDAARCCRARCAPRRPGSTRSSSAYAAARPSGVVTSASSSARTREVLGRERERVDDGLHVQAGAADEQRPLAARLDVGDRGARRVLEARDRPVLGRVGDVDQVVRHRGPLGGGRLGGPDVEPAVHLHRVDRDDLDVAERARDRERERRLPGRGGADEREVRGVTQARRDRDADARRGAARRDVDEVAAQPVRRRRT